MMPRMRTIDKAIIELHLADPGCDLTKNALRRLVISGQLTGVVRVGSKYLLDLDRLEQYLAAGTPNPTTTALGGVRRIEVRR